MKKSTVLLTLLLLFIISNTFMCSYSGSDKKEKPGYEIILTSGEVIQAYDTRIDNGWVTLTTKPGGMCSGNFVIYASSQIIKITSK